MVYIYSYKRHYLMHALPDTLLALALFDKSNIIYHNAKFHSSTRFACSYLACTLVFLANSSAFACCACSTCSASLLKLHKLHSRLSLKDLSAHICKVRS